MEEGLKRKNWKYVLDNIEEIRVNYDTQHTSHALFGERINNIDIVRNKTLLDLVLIIKRDKNEALLNSKHTHPFIRYCCELVLHSNVYGKEFDLN